MEYLNSIRAALKAATPVVAIPIPGHAPVCIRAKLLKGALKGVTIDSVELLENRWVKIIGHAGFVHTSCSIAPMSRYDALKAIGEWSIKERTKRIKVINQGVLSASAQREMKLKAAEKAGIAELIQAQKEEAKIIAGVKVSVFPVLTPVDAEERESIIEEYKAFRAQRGNRKRGSVIRWKLAKLKKDKAAMTIEKREYEEKPYTISPYARRRRVMTGKKTVLRRKKDSLKYAATLYQIGQLEKQYESISFREWHNWEYDGEAHGYWRDTWIQERPKELPYSVPYSWRDKNDEDESNVAQLKRMAEHLKNVRADIRALTPPADEEYTREQIAA
jgi:hypothetical protein